MIDVPTPPNRLPLFILSVTKFSLSGGPGASNMGRAAEPENLARIS